MLTPEGLVMSLVKWLCEHMAMAQEPLSALLAHRHLCAKREQTAVRPLLHGSGAAWLLIEGLQNF